jgi:integrase
MKLSEVLQRYKTEHLPNVIAGRQIFANLTQVVRYIGDVQCHLLDQTLLESAAAKLQAKYANATVNNRMTQFVAMIRWAVARLKISTEFIEFHRLPQSPRKATLTKEKVEEILSRLDNESWCFTRLLWLTGQRLRAVADLRWEQVMPNVIDFSRGCGGRQKRRAVTPITPAIRLTLDRLGAPGNGKIFKVSAKTLTSSLCRAGEACGVRVHAHMLRHSVATAMIAAGADLLQVSLFLGHASVATTQKHYLHEDPKFVLPAMAAVAL